ncbi:MAG: ABC transporter ATP-binding protein [Planctomycetota bacterium]|nr:ABC transporter ATP-binding protein [Planctomycetota bacterium]
MSTKTESAITFSHVSKRYRHFTLSDISLDFPRGTVVGLIGPNGAGKSTIMRIMMGLVAPDSGAVSVLGQPISSNQATAKREIGYFSEDMRLYKRESIGWHLQFVRSVFPGWDDDYASQLLSRFGLNPEQQVKGLSQGQRVKAVLLLILARRPQLLILDEPTNGLDPVARHEILTELMRVVEDENRTVLFSSHNTQDVEKLSDSITFIDRGRVIASRGRDEFLEQWRRIRLQAPAEWNIPAMPGMRLESQFRSQRVISMDQFDQAALDTLQASGATLEGVERMTLEEIFVSCVMRGREETSP